MKEYTKCNRFYPTSYDYKEVKKLVPKYLFDYDKFVLFCSKTEWTINEDWW